MKEEQENAVYIGVDWGDERHSVHLQAEGGGKIEHFELEQKPDVLHDWVAQLRQRAGGRKVAIAIEQRKGAVIHALLMYDFLVLYPINPKALARYRQAFRTSGAKDDPADSELLLELLSKHRDKLRAWIPDTVQDAQAPTAMRAAPENGESTRGTDQPDHQPAESTASAGW